MPFTALDHLKPDYKKPKNRISKRVEQSPFPNLQEFRENWQLVDEHIWDMIHNLDNDDGFVSELCKRLIYMMGRPTLVFIYAVLLMMIAESNLPYRFQEIGEYFLYGSIIPTAFVIGAYAYCYITAYHRFNNPPKHGVTRLDRSIEDFNKMAVIWYLCDFRGKHYISGWIIGISVGIAWLTFWISFTREFL